MVSAWHLKSIGPLALDKKTLQWVCVEDVANGKKCLCICPVCEEDVQSRQGEELRWHFAHLPGSECDASSLLNQLAKDWFSRPGQISLPVISGNTEGMLNYQLDSSTQAQVPHEVVSWSTAQQDTPGAADIVLTSSQGDIDVHFITGGDTDRLSSPNNAIAVDLREVFKKLHEVNKGVELHKLLAKQMESGIWINNVAVNAEVAKRIQSAAAGKAQVPDIGTPAHRRRRFLRDLFKGHLLRVPGLDKDASLQAKMVVHGRQLLTFNDVSDPFTFHGVEIEARCTKRGRSFSLVSTLGNIDSLLSDMTKMGVLARLNEPVLLAAFKHKDAQLRWMFNRSLRDEGLPYPL